jgi:hypothetical protein
MAGPMNLATEVLCRTLHLVLAQTAMFERLLNDRVPCIPTIVELTPTLIRLCLVTEHPAIRQALVSSTGYAVATGWSHKGHRMAVRDDRRGRCV